MSDPVFTPNGIWFITCQAVVSSRGRMHDVTFEWRRRDGIWDREGLGLTPTLVGSLHEFTLTATGPSTYVADGRIDPDPWVVIGGAMKITVQLAGDTGTYTGTFADQAITGNVTTRYVPALPVSRGIAQTRLEILEIFAREGSRSRLYDYSYAGRGTTDPTVGLPVIQAEDYGVRGDSGQEALPAIQAALDAAGAAGGGVVQLPPGILDCNVDAKLPALRIRHDRVILRGAGTGPDGTVLVNHRYSDTPDPKQPWRAGEHPLLIIGPDDRSEPHALTAVTAGLRGELTITVADASALRVGGSYLLRQLETADGSLARDLVQGYVAVAQNWQGAGKELVSQICTITAIAGECVTLDAPLHRSITQWPADLCAFPMITGAGVTNLHMRGLWGGFFVHHKNGEHDNGWDQVQFKRVRGGWAENLLHESTTSAVGLHDCLGCVIRQSRIIGNLGHNGFVIAGRSTGNLLLASHAGHNMHAFNVQGTGSGNALVDCSMDEPSGIDLHGGIGCDNLYDALQGGINFGGGSANAVPPRQGPGMVLWNWRCGHYNPYKPWQRYAIAADYQNVPGFIAAGVHGAYGQALTYKGPAGEVAGPMQEAWGWVESPGQCVAPRSLYAWQCARRAK
ncbi:MAG: DUF4955 domain-containing protein [Phycisphaerae bacterium]